MYPMNAEHNLGLLDGRYHIRLCATKYRGEHTNIYEVVDHWVLFAALERMRRSEDLASSKCA